MSESRSSAAAQTRQPSAAQLTDVANSLVKGNAGGLVVRKSSLTPVCLPAIDLLFACTQSSAQALIDATHKLPAESAAQLLRQAVVEATRATVAVQRKHSLVNALKALVASASSSGFVLGRAITDVCSCCGGDQAVVFAYDPLRRSLHCLPGGGGSAQGADASPHQPPVVFASGSSLVGLVASTGCGMLIRDTSAEPRFHPLVDGPAAALACAPIASAGKVVGVLQLRWSAAAAARDEAWLGEEETLCVEALQSVADCLAPLIQADSLTAGASWRQPPMGEAEAQRLAAAFSATLNERYPRI